jgi:hypothetical protein
MGQRAKAGQELEPKGGEGSGRRPDHNIVKGGGSMGIDRIVPGFSGNVVGSLWGSLSARPH